MLFRQKRLSEEQYLALMLERGLTPDGQLVDSVPLAPPVGYRKQPSMVEIVRNMVRGERLKAALDADTETFEDADDFDIPDDPDPPQSGYENELDPPLAELVEEGRKVMEARKKREKEAEQAVKPPEKPAGKPDSGGVGGKPPTESPSG